MYRDVTSTLVVHEDDRGLAWTIERFGMKVALADLLMPDLHFRIRLARTVISLAFNQI